MTNIKRRLDAIEAKMGRALLGPLLLDISIPEIDEEPTLDDFTRAISLARERHEEVAVIFSMDQGDEIMRGVAARAPA